jgi:hypothetical protein
MRLKSNFNNIEITNELMPETGPKATSTTFK